MIKEPLISIIMPVCETKDVWFRALQSIETQTYQNLEVIIVDDCSPTKPKVDEFKRLKIKMISNSENMGVSFSRNLGVKHANGDFLCFLDSDDEWNENKIESQVEYFRQKKNIKLPIIGCSCEIRYKNPKKNHIREPHSSRDLNDFISGCWFYPGSAVMIRKADFETLGGYDPHLRRLEDYDLFLRWSLAGGRFCSIYQPLCIVYRTNHAVSKDVFSGLLYLFQKFFYNFSTVRQKQLFLAYLALEGAATFIFSRKPFAGLPLLLISLCISPRLTIQIRDRWDKVKL